MRYSLTFRNSILKKVLPPESRSVYQVAKEAGVSAITIHSWMSKLKEGKLELDPEAGDPTPRDWPPAQKFRLLMEGKLLPEERRGEWLRQNGLHSEHLPLWEQELSNLMTDKQDNLKAENKDLKNQVRGLEKELLRKDRALAEVVALLTLKKKLDSRYQVDEAD
jgi:transposase